MEPNTSPAPELPPWPALTISVQATDSGNGSEVSSMKERRSRMTNSTPRMPPMSSSSVPCR